MNRKRYKRTGIWLQVVMLILTPFILASRVQAAGNLTLAVFRMDRMVASEANNRILVIVKPTTVDTETGFRITFAAGYTVAAAASVTVSTASLPATFGGQAVTIWPGIGSAASNVTGQVATFGSGDLAVGTQYGFYITGGITNPGSTGQYEIVYDTFKAGPTVIDSAQIGTRIITDDQIDVSAIVPPTFNFVLSANADAFTADLDPASVVSTTGVTITTSTNAAHGWVAWAKSANGALTSVTSGTPINGTGTVNGAPDTLSNGTNGYVIDCDLVTDSGTGTGTVTIDPEYNGGSTSAGGTPSTSYQPVASGSGTTNGDVVRLIERAAISAVQPAGTDYTDTLTVIGAGSF